MNIIHSQLRKNCAWYRSWHDHPRHQHIHWALFVAMSLLVFSFLSVEMGKFYFENGTYENTVAKAQTLNCSVNRSAGGTNAEWRSCFFSLINNTPGVDPNVSSPGGLAVIEAQFISRCGAYFPSNAGATFRCGAWESAYHTYYARNSACENRARVYLPTGNPNNPWGRHVDVASGPNNGWDGPYVWANEVFDDSCPPPPPPPPPPPSPRYIYYLNPYSVQAGETMVIAGQNLATTVNFYNASATLTQATGTLNSDSTEVTVTVPATLTPGQYTVSVGPNPDSNAVGLEIIIASPLPPPPPPGTTSATPCDQSIIDIAVQNNVSIICDIDPNSVYPGDTVTMSGVALVGIISMTPNSGGITVIINGTVSNNGDLVTFVIPPGTAPGDYFLSNNGVYGNAQSTETLTVLSSTAGQLPAQPPTTSLPPATPFQDIISSAFNYSVVVVGIAVFIMIMWGGFLWLTSAANPGNISTAKKYITNAILGAVLLLSAYAILYTINPELVGGTFNLGGIQAPSSQSAGVLRLIATSEVGAASAITAGCIIDLDARDFTALECDSNVAGGLNLALNPVLTTADVNVNNQIGATAVQSGGNQGTGRKIVVLDTGYNYNHQELRSSYLGGKDFINNDDDPIDDNGHGSHVAGIITGDGIDARALGVAPQTGIIAGKIISANDEGNWDKMIEAIYWAVDGRDGVYGTADDFRADAINLSIGSKDRFYNYICDNTDEITQRTVKAFQYARDNGVLPITAAGNLTNGVTMPGCIDTAFTVGAVDSSDRIAYFSGRGSPVDIVAPGVWLYSSLLGNSYGLKRGTSQAAPVVSGVAALIKAANLNFTVSELEQKITSTACDLGPVGKDSTFGWGRVSLSPGSCTLPPPVQPPGITGTVRISPTSCTKGAITSNQNCDLNISYTLTGITSATQLTVGKDNNFFQNVQCSSTPCTGQLSDLNPNGGLHQYDFRLPNNNVIARGNAYIYVTGTITANFVTCDKNTNLANPNCDVTLNSTAIGTYPGSLIVKKDGTNWRIIRCNNQNCAATINDPDPALGIHTYSLHDAADDSRLARVVLTVNGLTSCAIPGPNNYNNVVQAAVAQFLAANPTIGSTLNTDLVANDAYLRGVAQILTNMGYRSGRVVGCGNLFNEVWVDSIIVGLPSDPTGEVYDLIFQVGYGNRTIQNSAQTLFRERSDWSRIVP